jgi:hypothetical protein
MIVIYEHEGILCPVCDCVFETGREVEDHVETVHVECELCNAICVNQDELDDHYVSDHTYCQPCKAFFHTENGLYMHLQSKQHQQRVHPCGLHGCSVAGLSPSGLILHWERGRCASGINRRSLDLIVVGSKLKSILINSAYHLGRYPYEPERSPQVATSRSSWTRQGYECRMCSRLFKTLQSLNAHLRSGVHNAKRGMYRCPQAHDGCQRTFSNLGSLAQHIEQGRCGARHAMSVIMTTLREGMMSFRSV